MIYILSRYFLKNNRDNSDPEVRRVYGAMCGITGIVLNILLFIGKYIAGAVSGSIAVTADAFNNLSDAGSSVITLLGFKLAGKKPHQDHPYGHGRAEYIAGLAVSIVIIIMGLDLGKTSVGRIFRPEHSEFVPVTLYILCASLPVKLYMFFCFRSVGRKFRSETVLAAATDSLADAFTTAAVLASALIGHYFGIGIDAWTGALVSLLILYGGFCAARDTISPLLGRAPDPEFVDRIRSIVTEYPEIVGMHDLMVHDYGAGRVMISLHAEVPSNGSITVLHDVVDTIEKRLKTELNCSAVIHMDPISTDDEQINATRALVLQRIRERMDERITIHDFRMVTGPTHTNVIFDAMIPYDFPMDDEAAKAEIIRLVREIGYDYYGVVTIDHPIVSR